MILRLLSQWAPVVAVLGLLLPGFAQGEATLNDLNLAFSEQKWDAAAQMAHEILQRDPRSGEAVLKGAYSLFQKGLPNSALVFLKRLPLEQWKQIPQGQDRFVEIVSLFQKKVPLAMLPGRLDQVSEAEVPTYLRDEVLFAKGRAAYEQKNPQAKAYLENVSSNSRFFAEARYLLACLAIEREDYDTAGADISKIFQPQLFQQASEFWRDIGTQMTSHWGANLKVFMDAGLLNQSRILGELGTLAQARIRYAKKEHEFALEQYAKVPKDSALGSRANLERIWALLQLNRHDAARDAAVNLAASETYFEAIEARILHAVILADSHRGPDARKTLDEFETLYQSLTANLIKYRDYGVAQALPPFILTELKIDRRIGQIEEYLEGVKAESVALKSSSDRLFPVYRNIASQLDLLALEGKRAITAITKEKVDTRLKDLDQLYVQGRLIRAETYLEDRENLKDEFQKLGQVNEDQQKNHDQQLVALLSSVVEIVDGVFSKLKKRNPFLEFRHSEMLWELGTARLILSQTTDKPKNEQLGEALRLRSLALAETVVRDFPKFKKHAQAKFFLGFSQLELGQTAKGIETLEAYVREYSAHTHIPDAYRIIGDYYFDLNRWDKAEEAFVRILPFEDAPVIGYAFYKIAWCNYNRHNYAKALLGLERAIVWANNSTQKGQLLNLTREAGSDLISVYAEVGDPKKAMEYFESFIGGNTPEWLNLLAARYDEMGQYEKSTFLYNVLISLNGTADKGMGNYAPIIRGHFRLLQWPELLKATNELVENYRPQLLEPQLKDTPAFIAESTVRDVALAQHFEYGTTTDPAVIDRIIALDKLYLSAFSKWPESQSLLYTYAFFLGAKKKLVESAESYKAHWVQFRPTLKEPLKEESIRNVLHSLELVDATTKMGEAVDAPVPEVGQDLMTYAQEYLALYPKTKHARAISFLYGTTLLKYGRLDEGIKVSQAILDGDAKDDFGKNAFRNLKVAYYKKKDWGAANQWAVDLLARPGPELKPFAGDLSTVKEETLFLWASETKENPKSAELFLRLANDPKNTRLKERALYNAVARFNDDKDRIKVLQFSRDLEKMAPKSEYLPQLAGIRASILQEAGDYVQALPHFQALLKRTDKDVTPEILQQARLNAALILQATDQTAAALALYKEYLDRATDKSAKGVAQANAGLKYLDARGKRGLASTWKPWELLEKDRREFLSKPLPKKGELGERIKAGGQRLEELVNRFSETAAAKDTPEDSAFEALCAVPSLYRGLAAGIRDLALAIPKKGREEIAAELDKVAKPIDEKAAKWAKDCLAKAGEAEHEGPLFREVSRLWGWESDPAKRERIGGLLRLLESKGPWVWSAAENRTESEWIDRNLKTGGDKNSWYALGRHRLVGKRWGLARLTLLDALAKTENTSPPAPTASPNPEAGTAPVIVTEAGTRGGVLNALAYVEWQALKPSGITTLFENAAQEGSRYALVNIALVHLQAGRVEQASAALRRANDLGAFDRDVELKAQVARVIQP